MESSRNSTPLWASVRKSTYVRGTAGRSATAVDGADHLGTDRWRVRCRRLVAHSEPFLLLLVDDETCRGDSHVDGEPVAGFDRVGGTDLARIRRVVAGHRVALVVHAGIDRDPGGAGGAGVGVDRTEGLGFQEQA